MADPHRQYEIRCPVHGFIAINDWEREIISQPSFALRRIRQLAWTDLVYPGAMHTRFEHSLGVMHVATQLYEAIVKRSAGLLKSELAYARRAPPGQDFGPPNRASCTMSGMRPFACGRRAFPGQPGEEKV